MKQFILLLVSLAVVISSCGNNTNQGDSSTASALKMSEPIAKSDFLSENSNVEIDRKIIRTGNISFKSEDLDKVSDSIKKLIHNYEAYITRESRDKYSKRIEQRFEVKVPANRFDQFISDLEKIAGKIESKSINSQDITGKYIDTETRLKNKRKLENRYIELLSKAQNVSEMLQIENQLNNIRSEIESAESILKNYDSRISYSTLNIEIFKQITMNEKTSWGSRFSNGFSNGIEYFILFFVGLTNLWPFIILAFLLIFIIIRISKRKKRNK